jgi:O-antigen/teichoic acid export membrane protein
MMPIMTIIIVFPSEIARILLGPDFEVAGESMRFLAMAALIYLINSVHRSQILAVDRSELYATITLLDFGTFAFFLILLVPREILGITLFGMGFSGAALAMLAKSIIMIAVIRVVVRNLTDTSSNHRVLLHIVAATIAGSFVFILSSFHALRGLFDMIAYGLLVIAIFLGILALIREFRKDDVLYFLDIINARKMWDYMTNEVRRSK